MGVDLPYLPVLDVHTSNPFLSSNSTLFRRQLERLNDFREKRAGVTKKEEKTAARRLVQQQFRDDQLKATLPPAIYSSLKENPKQLGGPRQFAILLAPHEVAHEQEMLYDTSKYAFEGHTIHFSAFREPGHGFWINNSYVPPEQIILSPNKMIYTFSANLQKEDGGGVLHGYINFIAESMPYGLLIHNSQSAFAVQLKPYASIYSISVSADAGAVDGDALTCDVNSEDWKNATWETKAGILAFDVVNETDPVLPTPMIVVEFGITDKKSTTPSKPPSYDYALTAADSAKFTSVFTTTKDKSTYLGIHIKDKSIIPSASDARKSSPVESLFGVDTLVLFDKMGRTFVGAYRDVNRNVFMIKGEAILPVPSAKLSIVHSGISCPAKLLSTTHFPPAPVETPADFSVQTTDEAKISSSKRFAKLPPLRGAFPTLSSPSTLPVTGLLNISPMRQDQDGQWYDAASRAAMSDIHDGILTFMDGNLHNTFVGGGRPELDPQVRSIIMSNPDENGAFYKRLQVPFLVSALSSSPQPSSQFLNGARGSKVLRDLPANDPVYKQQSSDLYTLRWKQMFPIMQDYFDDQANNDYTTEINNAGNYLKNDLQERFKDVPDPDGQQGKAMQTALQDLDDLQTYAVSNNLYWAVMVFYYAQTYYLPFLQAKMTSSALSHDISTEIKAYGALLGLLEHNGSTDSGKSFMSTFNDMIRAFTLTTILPQFVDAEGNKSDYIEFMDSIIDEFLKTYADTGDADMQEHVADLTALKGDQQAIQRFMDMLLSTQALASSFGNWGMIVDKLAFLAESESWYKKLPRGAGMLGSFLMLTCVVSLIMVFQPGKGWKSMSPKQRGEIVTSAVSIFVFALVKVAQRTMRVYAFWDQLGTMANRMKVLFGGNEELLDAIGPAAEKAQNTFSKWLTRTAKESMNLSEEETTTTMMIFGKNASEFLVNVVGTVLGLVNIALAAWDLATTTDPLQKTMDSLNIISGSLAVLGIAAGWIASSLLVVEGASIAAVAILEVVAACLGPLSAVFAVVGLIVMIVMMFRHQDPPDPMKDFAEKQAKAAGLYMPEKTQIDYFNVIPPDGISGISYDGVAFQNGTKYLQVSAVAGTPLQAPVYMTGTITHMPDMCLNVQTDSLGNTRVWTTTSDADGKPVQVCLAINDGGQVVALPPPSKTTKDSTDKVIPVDPKVYARQVQQQQWLFTCTGKGPSVSINDTKYITTASFSLQSASATTYLTVDGTGTKIQLETSPQSWTCSMQSVGPSKFTYAASPWTLYTTSRDELIAPQMDTPGSQPLTWSITPTLPNGLELRKDAMYAGAIGIIKKMTPAEAKAKIYTVTASILINAVKYSQQAQVTIEVKPPPV